MDDSQFVVFITGASRGIGKAVADACHASGLVVIGCARSSIDVPYHYITADVSNEQGVGQVFTDIFGEYGRLDALITCAGIAHELAPLEQIPPSVYKDCMRANVDSVFLSMHAALRHMKEHDSGIIVNVASRAARRPHPHLAAYSASKAAVLSLTQAAAKDLNESNSQVRCMSVSPGGVNTDMRRKLFGEEDANAQQSAESVAQHIVNIVTGEQQFANGDDMEIIDGEIRTITSL